jgi:Spy/CpxP family protein refolding chaperone
MKKLIVSLAAIATAAGIAAPAAAQGYRHHDGGMNINERQDRIERRIDRGLHRGDLTRREASRLRDDFYRIAHLESRYRVNGLSSWERADLDRRFDRLEAQLRFERRDHQYSRR